MRLAACILGRSQWRHGRSRDETKYRRNCVKWYACEARCKMSHVNNQCVKCCMWCLKWFEIDVNWSNTLCDLIQHGHFLSKIYAFWSILRGIIWHYFPHCKLIWSWQTLCYNFHRYNFYRYGYWVWIYYNLDYFYVYIRGCFGSCIATIQHIGWSRFSK